MRRFESAGISILLFVFAVVCPAAERLKVVTVGEPVDYNDIVIYPDRWDRLDPHPRLYPWEGEQLAFLTIRPDFEPEVITHLLNRLDSGWLLYAELTGREPRPFKQLRGKPTITAVPGAGLTCGYGCGYVGFTGLEVAGFYDKDYAQFQARPEAMPHYYFYEMGRNFYTFGDRHSLFTTGYAVFMRYVCMDVLHCEDHEPELRKTIEAAEGIFAKSGMGFFEAFTSIAGLDEKAPRLKDEEGQWIYPSDQPVMYASAMLKLRRDCGGEQWLRRFYRHLATCPSVDPKSDGAALGQSLNWLVSASCAAGKDLSPVFCDRWHLPLNAETRQALADVDWTAPDCHAARIVTDIVPIASK